MLFFYKRYSLVVLFSLTVIFSSGQDYYHGLGAQWSYSPYNLSYDTPTFGSYSSAGIIGLPGIFYKATFSFDQFAVSAYPFIGFNLSANSQTGGSGSFGYGLPINAEYYFGDLDDKCFFIGAGGIFSSGGVYTSSSSIQGSGGGSITTVGPQVSLGGQFYREDNLIGIRLSYGIGMNNTKVDVPGANVTEDKKSIITFGIYKVLGL